MRKIEKKVKRERKREMRKGCERDRIFITHFANCTLREFVDCAVTADLVAKWPQRDVRQVSAVHL